MANKYQGELTIRLDRVRTLKFDFNALAEFEEASGLNLASFTDLTTFGLHHWRILLWAALLWDHKRNSPPGTPPLTLEQAGGFIESAQGENMTEKLKYVAERLLEAMNLVWESGEEKKGVMHAPAASTPSASATTNV